MKYFCQGPGATRSLAYPCPPLWASLFVQELISHSLAISPCPSIIIWPSSASQHPCLACLGVHPPNLCLGPASSIPTPGTRLVPRAGVAPVPSGFPDPDWSGGMCLLVWTPPWWTCSNPATLPAGLLLLLSPGIFSFPHVFFHFSLLHFSFRCISAFREYFCLISLKAGSLGAFRCLMKQIWTNGIFHTV